MTAIQPDDYFASVEARFESPSPYGRKEITVEAPKHACECGKTFDTEQGLRVHKGRAHGKPDTAPEQKVNPGEEALPDTTYTVPPETVAADYIGEPVFNNVHIVLDDLVLRIPPMTVAAPDYRMELIETLAELATWEATLDDPDPIQATLARIKAVARDV